VKTEPSDRLDGVSNSDGGSDNSGQLKNTIRSDIRVHTLELHQASVDTTWNSEDEPTDDPLSDSSITWLVDYKSTS